MASNDSKAAPRRQPFTLYAAKNGRLYARNRDQKVIDLGEVVHNDGCVGWRLDGNGESGGGFAGEEQVLHDLAAHLRYLWLDGQFTAVADARSGELDLDGATEMDITLDELAPGEKEFDATV